MTAVKHFGAYLLLGIVAGVLFYLGTLLGGSGREESYMVPAHVETRGYKSGWKRGYASGKRSGRKEAYRSHLDRAYREGYWDALSRRSS